jgi:methionine synthase I (cobalamin-dependent)
MHELIAQLIADSPVITDGAWGTQMQSRGLESGACPDQWNLTHPELVQEVARTYVDAGSQIVLTNTFCANSVVLAGYGLAEQAGEISRAGAEISCRAAGKDAHVFASIGPSGKMLMMGEVTEDQLLEAFSEQAAALAAGGAHALVIETMADLAEARLAIRAAQATGLAVVACMVFDSGADFDRTMMGVTPEEAAKQLTEAGADVVGANCGQGIAGYVDICRRMRTATDRPLWIKANAGIPEVIDGQVVYTTSPAEFAARGPALVEAGANFIGGCCGTGPEFISALKQETRS